MKKFIFIIFIFTLVLVGCSSTNTKEDGMLLWVHVAEGTGEAEAYQHAVDRYNEENPSLTPATIEFIPRDASGGGYEDKINAAISSGDLPDVIAIDGPNVSSYVSSSIIQPIGSYLDAEQLDDYIDGAIEVGTVDDELYALGGKDDTILMYYNTDLVDPSAMSTDVKNPNTWKDILDTCDKLDEENASNPDWVCIDYNFSFDEWAPYSLLPIFWSEGVDLISEDGLTVTDYFNSKEAADVLQLIKDMVTNGYVSTSSTGELQRFTQGNSAFRLDGSWNIAYYKENFPDLNWGATYYPVTKNWDGQPYVANGSWVFGVTANSQYPEDAAQLVWYLSNKDTGLELYDALNAMPNTKSAQAELSDKVEDVYNLSLEQLSNSSRPRPITPSYPTFSKQFGSAVDQAINTDKTMQEVLDESITPIEMDLERFQNE